MYNLAPFDIARSYQPLTEIPFISKQCHYAQIKKPFKDLRIIQNIPLSLESICKLEPLVLGGAHVSVSINKAIQPSSQNEAIKLVKEIGLEFCPDQDFKGEYDFILDCGAELANKICPKQGIVELTQTGSEIYKKLDLDVAIISVDDSLLKQLETFFGTGEGCVRAFRKLTGKNIQNQHFVIFGHGKVGQGVLYFLIKEHIQATVVEVDNTQLAKVREKGFNALHIHEDKLLIEQAIESAFAVVTATGVKNLISSHFDKQLFKGKVLANIGVEDEYGENFENHEVLYHKQPINFSLADPTKMRYLDPSFFAHNYGIEHILTHKPEPGYHSFPKEMDDYIVKEWQKLFEEDLSLLQGCSPMAFS